MSKELKCKAFSGRTVHQLEDQINFFLKDGEGEIKILNLDISITDNNAGGVLIYEEGDLND